jgi:hypothetical protein
MNAQDPAVGILKRNDWGDTKMYNIPCSCCGRDCEHNVWVEADDDTVSVTVYTKQKTKFWSMNRFQIMWRLLTRGYVEYESSIIMSPQQSVNYGTVLLSAASDVAEFKRNKDDKSI